MSINKVFISGNLFKEPDLRVTSSGMAVLNIGVCVNDKVKDKYTDEWKEYPNWIECTMFGKRAEFFSDKLEKGSKVCIEGKLHYSSWETKEGKKASKININIDNIEIAQWAKKEQANIWETTEAQPLNDGRYHGEGKLDDVPF